MDLVRALAAAIHRQVKPHVELDELISLGTAGLLEAIDRYDADRGTTLATYAYYRVRGAIYDGLRTMGNLPRQVYRQAALGRRTDDYLENRGRRAAYSREPGAPAKAVSTLATTRALSESIRGVIAIQVATRAAVEPHVGVADPRVVPSDEQVLQQERRARLRAALLHLPERERLVIERCYFEERALGAVAQELGLSASWTSRLHARAVERLRDLLAEDEGD